MQENLSDEALKGPSLEAIARATSDLPSLRNAPKPVPSTECPADVNIYFSCFKIYIFVFYTILSLRLFIVPE